MTSAQLPDPGRSRRTTVAFLVLVAVVAAGGCGPRLQDPMFLSTGEAENELWAVAPFVNESGVSDLDVYRVAELFTQETQQVDGVDTVPVNRVIAAMRRLDLRAVTTSSEAMTLMNTLGVDALVIGTVTAYDPYPPFSLGAAVELHRRSASSVTDVDPDRLIRSPTGFPASYGETESNPVAQSAGVFEATNHRVRHWLAEYSQGRSQPESAYGADIFLVRMELYTKFVSFCLLRDLVGHRQAALPPEAGLQDPR